MRKIAESIEYSPATIYLHFQNRDEIATALVRAGFEKLVAQLTPAASIADPLERVVAIGTHYLAFAQAEPETYRLIFMEDERFAAPIMHAIKDSGDDAGGGAFDFLRATVDDLIAAGTFRALDSSAVAALLWAGLHGIAALKLTCRDYPFAGTMTEPGALMIDTLIRGFRA